MYTGLRVSYVTITLEEKMRWCHTRVGSVDDTPEGNERAGQASGEERPRSYNFSDEKGLARAGGKEDQSKSASGSRERGKGQRS